jgi:hypothetical protein
MPSEWAEVDTLIRELGAVRSEFERTDASESAKAAIETAIAEATRTVLQTLNAPERGEAVLQARQAIASARQLVAAIGAEMERSRRAIERAGELGVKSPRRDDRGAS